MSIELYHGDCLEVMTHIASKSIDCVICDLPYEVTANKWDSLINLETLWNEYIGIEKYEKYFEIAKNRIGVESR